MRDTGDGRSTALALRSTLCFMDRWDPMAMTDWGEDQFMLVENVGRTSYKIARSRSMYADCARALKYIGP